MMTGCLEDGVDFEECTYQRDNSHLSDKISVAAFLQRFLKLKFVEASNITAYIGRDVSLYVVMSNWNCYIYANPEVQEIVVCYYTGPLDEVEERFTNMDDACVSLCRFAAVKECERTKG